MAEPQPTTAGASSTVRASRSRAADAITSPTAQARAGGLAGLLQGAEFSATNEAILHADPDLSKTVAISGFWNDTLSDLGLQSRRWSGPRHRAGF